MKAKVLQFRRGPKKLPETEYTICTQCDHLLLRKKCSCGDKKCDHNYLCKAAELEEKIDPLDGKLRPVETDEDGYEYIVHGRRHRRCRDVNGGHCQNYKARQPDPT